MNRAVPPQVGLLFSGGLDSSILASHLLTQGCQVQPLYVASQLIWEDAELPYARRFLRAIAGPRLDELVVLEMPARDLYVDHWSVTGIGVPDARSPDEAVYLPGRNPLLVLKARMWCQLNGIGRLAIGCLGGNPFVDASDGFFKSFSALLNRATESVVEVTRPLAKLSKLQVLELGRELPLEYTFSCIDPQEGLHCGRCNKCAERRNAFRLLEMNDPTHYLATAAQVAR
jgi:7-cyano-7-deazaguanine synthase